MPSETMTSRERWLAVLNRDTPDRIPMDYWATEEASQKLVKHLGCNSLDEALDELHVDRPLKVGPKYVGPELQEGENAFGIRTEKVQYEAGVYAECVYHPLAEYDSIEGIEENYTWPKPDWWDHSVIPAQVEGHEDKPIRGGGSEPFLTYCHLRGQEQAYMDLAINPDMVEGFSTKKSYFWLSGGKYSRILSFGDNGKWIQSKFLMFPYVLRYKNVMIR